MQNSRVKAVLLAMLAMGFTAGAIAEWRAEESRLVCVAHAGLHCFDSLDLSLRWRARRELSFDTVLPVGDLTLASGSSGLSSFSNDGREAWRHDEFGPVFPPRLANQSVYFGSLGGALVRLAASDGALAWRRQLPGWVYSPALVGDLLVTGGEAGKLFAFDKTSGEPRWTRDLGQELVYRPVEAGDNAVIATTFDGRIRMFGGDGETRWEQQFSVAARSPLVIDNRLFSSLFDGRVVALATDDGRLLWQQQLAQPVELLAAAETILAYDVDQLVALDIHGKILWRKRFTEELVAVRVLPAGELVVFLRRSTGLPYASLVGQMAGE